MSAEFPIYRVTTTGSVERLGLWRHDARELVLERLGYPLLAPGTHPIEGDLPWLFWDMAPSGFMGNRFAMRQPQLSLPSDPRTWTRDHVLRVLSEAGSELTGNLLVGDDSRSHFEQWQPDLYKQLANEVVELDAVLKGDSRADSGSSLGGERPKLVSRSADGTEMLIKFSPPVGTTAGERWSDLLVVESLCAQQLQASGVRAATSRADVLVDRRSLSCPRFDRLPNRGRVGAGTLYWLAMERWGDVQLPAPEVTRRLAESGELPARDAETCAKVHAFSAAIGNNDAHLGNYGLVFDDEGKARLAPIYDVLPMVFAPRHDELPDAYVKPRPQKPTPEIQVMVEDLAARITSDEHISTPFKELWLRYVGL